MISFSIPTKKKGSCLRLLLNAKQGSTIIIKGVDHNNNNMVYFRLEMNNFNHKGYLFLPMPLTPDTMTIVIGAKDYSSVTMSESPKLVPLKTAPLPLEYTTPRCLDLYRFVENLAVNSAFCMPWSDCCHDNLIYSKNDNTICAKVASQIIDEDELGNKKVSSTPARVARPVDGSTEDFIFIEISQAKRNKMSVYMCVAMLFHELGHYILNTSDEQLADQFSRMIYFDRGYPKSEYIYSFTDVFSPIKNKDGSINAQHDQDLSDRLRIAHQDISQMEQKYY